MDGRDGALFQDRRQCLTVCIGEEPGLAWRLAVDQPLWTIRIEAKHPVADDLQGDVSKPRRLAA